MSMKDYYKKAAKKIQDYKDKREQDLAKKDLQKTMQARQDAWQKKHDERTALRDLRREAKEASVKIARAKEEAKLRKVIEKSKQHESPSKFKKFAQKFRSATDNMAKKVSKPTASRNRKMKKPVKSSQGNVFGGFGGSSSSVDPFGGSFGKSGSKGTQDTFGSMFGNSKKKKKRDDPFAGMFG